MQVLTFLLKRVKTAYILGVCSPAATDTTTIRPSQRITLYQYGDKGSLTQVYLMLKGDQA